MDIIQNLKVKQEDTRPHPLFGVYGGRFLRHFRSGNTRTAGEDIPVAPVPVKRELQEQAWTLVDGVLVTPEIKHLFGSPNQEKAFVRLTVNGVLHRAYSDDVPVQTSLAEYLRNYLQLTGTKVSCGEAGCGACTVVIRNGEQYRVANACLRPLFSLDDCEVITTEGLGSKSEGYHPVQKTMASCDATQCGMCTPGMVMSIYGFMKKTEGTSPSDQEVEKCIQGNTCRCTGYRPIYKAIRQIRAAPSMEEVSSAAEDSFEKPSRRFYASSGGALWLNCAGLNEVFSALRTYGHQPHRLTVGNTSVGVVKYYPPHPNDQPVVYINVASVEDLRHLLVTETAVTFGAANTISEVISTLSGVASLGAVVDHLKSVATPQVRDMSSWAGNLMIAKTHRDFPSDLAVIFTMMDATLTISDGVTETTTKVNDFLAGGELDPKKIITKIEIPLPAEGDVVDSYKIMRRHTNTHTEVSASFHFKFSGDSVASARMVLGNISLGPLVCTKTTDALKSKLLTADGVNDALIALDKEAVPEAFTIAGPWVTGAGPEYRKSLAKSLLYKAWLNALVTKKSENVLDAKLRSAAIKYMREKSSGLQSFTPVHDLAPVTDYVGKIEGLIQTSGEAKFTAEIPRPAGSLYGYMVAAKQIGRVHSIDASIALGQPGVVAFIAGDTVKSVGANLHIQAPPGVAMSPVPFVVFASEARFVGEFVGMICATSVTQAQAAASRVVVKFQQDSRESSGMTRPNPLEVQRGQIIEDPAPIEIVGEPNPDDPEIEILKGNSATTGQKHCYMENQVALAIPEEDSLRVVVASQGIDMTSKYLAGTMNMPMNKVVCEHIRTGGHYGGKVEQSTVCAAAACVAAKYLGKPVLVQLDLNQDMSGMGGRTPHTSSWEVGYSAEKKITSLKQTNLTDMGVMENPYLAVASNAGAYTLPNTIFTNNMVLSSTPPATFCRAPGHLAGAVFTEMAIGQVAHKLGVHPIEVQEQNLGPFVQPSWSECKKEANFDALRKDCDDFNAKNRYRKRGVYMLGAQYLCPQYWLEKARITIKADGSVTVNHSGMECGQGMNTKATQALAYELKKAHPDFDMNLVSMVPQSTADDVQSSTMFTAGSGTSESVAWACAEAAKTLVDKLKPYASSGSWVNTVSAALKAGVDLVANGIRMPGFTDPNTWYFVGVTTCMQAEIDVLTGETQLLNVQVVHDGLPLNPSVDIGQVEGCTVMAIGHCLIEEIKRGEDHRLLNNGTWDYKIPSPLDVPVKLNVKFLQTANDQPYSTYGTKFTGEPAMVSGCAAYFAVKEAVYAARKDAGESEYFEVELPLSTEKVQQACLTQL